MKTKLAQARTQDLVLKLLLALHGPFPDARLAQLKIVEKTCLNTGHHPEVPKETPLENSFLLAANCFS